MLKTRLIPVLYIKNGLIVRSEGFSYHQNIGNIINEAKRYNEWDIDELIYIDISREKVYDMRRDDHKVKSVDNIEMIIKEISKVCFMPLTFGGGIRTMSDIDLRVRNGADKITLNTAAVNDPLLITQAAEKYGAQCIVISVDYRKIDGRSIVFSNNGTISTGMEVTEWIKRCKGYGAGEIFLNSIDRDGKAEGYDMETISAAVQCTNLPVIACGGTGDEYDFVDLAQQTKVAAIAAGNWFHFVERSYPRAKKTLKNNNINVR
jgi:cyclase